MTELKNKTYEQLENMLLDLAHKYSELSFQELRGYNVEEERRELNTTWDKIKAEMNAKEQSIKVHKDINTRRVVHIW